MYVCMYVCICMCVCVVTIDWWGRERERESVFILIPSFTYVCTVLLLWLQLKNAIPIMSFWDGIQQLQHSLQCMPSFTLRFVYVYVYVYVCVCVYARMYICILKQYFTLFVLSLSFGTLNLFSL